jgi:putative FmdB family regulatory protein
MPLYEYNCRTCERDFEVLSPAGGGEAVRCPGCDGVELDRLFGLPARGRVVDSSPATNCRGDGPPCGAPRCGRKM